MEQVKQLVALMKASERPLNVPMGKSDNKMMTLLDLVLDLRLDNEQLRQENEYLRQLLQELEKIQDSGRADDLMPEDAWLPDDESLEALDELLVQQQQDAEDDIIDWEALYFETRPSDNTPYTSPTHQNGQQGAHRNGNYKGHISAVVDVPEQAQNGSEPSPTTIEAVSLEQLMDEIAEHEEGREESTNSAPMPPQPSSAPAAVPHVAHEPSAASSAFDAILRDPVTGRRLAEVSLEGPLITSRDLAGNQRRVWGFRMVDGNLRSEWRRGKHLYLCLKNGTAVRVRVAGLPSDESNSGYVELV